MNFNSDLLRRLNRVYGLTIGLTFDRDFNLDFYKEWKELADRCDDTDVQCQGLAEAWYELNVIDMDGQPLGVQAEERVQIEMWLTDNLGSREFTCIEDLAYDARLIWLEQKIEEWIKSNIGKGVTLAYTFHAMSGWGERYKLSGDYHVVDAWSKGDFATLTVRFHDPDQYDDPTDSVDMDELVDTVDKPIHDGDTDVQMMYLYSNKTVVTANHGLEYHPVSYFHARFATDEGMEKIRDLIAEEHHCAEIKFRRSGESKERLKSFSMRLQS